ncbi:AraC family transcriptional regulator [Acetobacterium malicum]|uniref:AraC family transcriptional regulator n=1 Tax=Acetobacterium malicum TaxID=52692 RepID=A0ABR6YYU0_9FIRM|nr:GyrI-like domain-containing protein [Acetobacterium malicum]MBC3900407.1 AraC family transcriptional regulator [Acetobacterium malicum]
MDYEVVQLTEKQVAGLKIRTSNDDPQMGEKIGSTWQRFYGDGIEAALAGRENDKCIGLYSNYENGVDGAYDVMVGCEVAAGVSQPESVEMATIAAGSYAKFVVHGDVQQAVGDFWMKLWEMKLDRKFGSDFEEYQPGEDMANAEIHLYISLN